MTTAATTAAATSLRREHPGKVIAASGKSFPSARRGADSRPRVPVYRDDPAKTGAGHNTADSRLGCGLLPGKLGSLCRIEKASAAAKFTAASALAEVRAEKASAAANAPVATALAEAQEGVAAPNTPVATTLAEAQKVVYTPHWKKMAEDEVQQGSSNGGAAHTEDRDHSVVIEAKVMGVPAYLQLDLEADLVLPPAPAGRVDNQVISNLMAAKFDESNFGLGKETRLIGKGPIHGGESNRGFEEVEWEYGPTIMSLCCWPFLVWRESYC
ncbi:hypothetical protein CsSME_00007750 [Camellia sinensis var. sinensis]